MWENRIAPLSGLAAVILVVASALTTGNVDFMPPTSDVLEFYAQAPRRIMVGAYLGILASFFLIWFAGSVYRHIRDRGAFADRLAVTSLGGGMAAGVLLAVAQVVNNSAAERVMIHGDIDPGSATTLFDLSGGLLGSAVPLGLAVLLGALGLSQVGPGGQHRGIGWVSSIIAAGLISPLSWLVMVAGFAWCAVLSVLLYRVGSTEGRSTSATASLS